MVKALFYLCLIVGAMGQYEDKRCRCVCPSPVEVSNETSKLTRQLFIADVPPNQCNCIGAVLPRVANQSKGREAEYCLRCECKYETRNTTVIKVTVITVVWLLGLLVVYCGFLMCLDPLAKRQRQRHRPRPRAHPRKDPASDEAQFLMVDSDDEADGI